jgi:hypothetical protein
MSAVTFRFVNCEARCYLHEDLTQPCVSLKNIQKFDIILLEKEMKNPNFQKERD